MLSERTRRYKQRDLDGGISTSVPGTDDEFHSYWIQFQILVPNTYSLLEEHESCQQGESVFQGVKDTLTNGGVRDDLDDPTHDAEEDTTGAQGDGGGTVVLPRGRGTPDGILDPSTKVVVYVPGTDTAITYDPEGETFTHVNEGTPQLTDTTTKATLSDTNKDLNVGKTGQTIDPNTINKVTLVPDVTNDGLEDMIVCTTNGAYLMKSDNSVNGGYDPPVLISDSSDNVKDAVSIDFDGDTFRDIVLVTDGNTPNRVYLGDGSNLDQSNMGTDGLGGLRHEVLLDGGDGTPSTDTTAVVAIDVDGTGGTESLIVTNSDDVDVFYYNGDSTGVKLNTINYVGSVDEDTTSVTTTELATGDTLVVFGKSSSNVGIQDTYVVIPLNYNPNVDTLTVKEIPGSGTRNTHTVIFKDVVTDTGTDKALYIGYDRQDESVAQNDKDDPVLGLFYKDVANVDGSADFETHSPTNIQPGFPIKKGSGDESEFTQGIRDMTLIDRSGETTPKAPDVVFTTDGGTVLVVVASGTPGGTYDVTYDETDPSTSNDDVKVRYVLPDGSSGEVVAGITGQNVERETEANSGIVRHADLDGDGYQDVISGRHVVLNTDTNKGDFTAVPVEYWKYGPTPFAVTPADVDGDGDVDLVVVPRDATDPVIQYLLNDGSGDFSKAERVVPLSGNPPIPIAIANPADVTTTVVTGHLSGPNGAIDDVLDVVLVNNGELRFYISTSTTKADHKYATGLTRTEMQYAGGAGAITDMLITSLSGQPASGGGAAAQQDVVYVANGVVYGVDANQIDTTINSVPEPVALSSGGLDLKTVAVGNVMGDARKTVLTTGDGSTPVRPTVNDPVSITEGLVDSAGNVDDATQIDARSLDLVYSSDTTLYVKQGVYDADGGTYLAALAAATEYKVALYNTASTTDPRAVTALEVHDTDGNGFDDAVVSFSSTGIYRSVFYMKVDFTDDGNTDLDTLRDDTCDANPRASSCRIFAGPADPSQLVGVADAAGNFPAGHTAFGVPEMVLSPASGSNSAAVAGFADADAHGTHKMELADFDNDGNMDVLYGTDANEAARVSLAKPYVKTNGAVTGKATATTLTNENDINGLPKSVADDLMKIENGMLNFLDAMLLNAPTVTVHPADKLDNPNYPAGASGEDSYAYVNRGPTTQNNVDRPDYDQETVPVIYPGKPGEPNAHTYVTNGVKAAGADSAYDVPVGPPDDVADSATANVGGARCRAPAESVLPMTVSLQIDFPTVRPFRSLLFPSASPFLFLQTRLNLVLSPRLFAKQVPCVEPDFPNCSAQTRPHTVL